MTGSPVSRRRFLTVSLAAIGAGAAGAVAWRSTSDVAEVAPTLPPAAPAATTTTDPPRTTTTAPTPDPTTTEPPPTITASPAPTPIEVICRDAWGAVPVVGQFALHTIEHITVHHTAVVLASNTDAPARARQHQRYHQSLGWPDLAYHYLIDANGHVYEGRPFDAVGDTATDYDPTGHFLVCCEGDFNQQEIGEDQYRSLVNLVAWGSAEFGVDPATIRGHRDLATTSCPGDNLYPLVAEGTLAADVLAAIAGSGFDPTSVCGSDGADLVAAIEAGLA